MYVRPVLKYSSSVWDPSTKENMDKLEQNLIKRAARFVTGEYANPTCVTTLGKKIHFLN